MGVDPRSLQVGQAIAVNELNFGVQLKLCGDGETGLTVVEVNAEYLVLDDVAGGSTRRIPLYLINTSDPVVLPETPAAAA